MKPTDFLMGATVAVTWGMGLTFAKAGMTQFPPIMLIAWVAMFTAPQLFVTSFLLEDGHMEALANADIMGRGTVLYLGLAMTAFGYGLWFHLIAHHPVSHVMPFLLLLPVAAGAALVLAGVGLILYRQMRKPGEPPAAPLAVPPD